MSAPNIRNADFAALVELAESKFRAWRLREICPERDRRLSDLKKQNLATGGRAVSAQGIYRELLEREVRQRIASYAAEAREHHNSEILSKPRLDEYRIRIMSEVASATAGLKHRIVQDARAAGDLPESALPIEHRYTQLQSEILNVVNAELRVLEAEGKLAGQTEAVTLAPPATMEPEQRQPLADCADKGRKRGPKPDYEAASRLAEVVARVAPDGEWRGKLDDVCEALDEEKIPFPAKWRRDREYRCWANCCLEKPILIKAILYRLETAEQRKKATPETPS